jgi:hypothetical protein
VIVSDEPGASCTVSVAVVRPAARRSTME